MKQLINSNFFQKLVPPIILVGLGLICIKALFHPGLYSAHDIWHQVARLYHYSQAVNEGELLPTWISDLAKGYGYPLFYFSYHLPWIVALPLLWIGFPIFTSLKIIFGGAFIAAGLSMYWFVLAITKNKHSALAAAGIYLISPYHFFSIFVAAAIGTVFQFAIIPLLFLSIYQIVVDHKKVGIALLAVAGSASILAHLMTFVFILPFLFLFFVGLLLITRPRAKKGLYTISKLVVAGLLALGISAFYLLPTVVFLPLVKAGNDAAGFGDIYLGGFVTLRQLFYSTWGFAPIVSMASDSDLSFQVGIIQWLSVFGSGVLLATLGIYQYFEANYKKVLSKNSIVLKLKQVLDFKFMNNYWQLSLLSLALFIISIWLMLTSSKFVWDFVANFFTLDYPFRYLLLAVLFASFLGGWLIGCIRSRLLQQIAVVLFILLAFYTNRNHMPVNMYTDFKLQDYVDAELTTNTFHEYLPVDANSELLSQDHPPLVKDIPAELIYSSATKLTVGIKLDAERLVNLRQYDFPGQHLYVNGYEIQRQTNPGKLISVTLPPGEYIVDVLYENPPIYQVALSISGIAILITIYIYMKRNK